MEGATSLQTLSLRVFARPRMLLISQTTTVGSGPINAELQASQSSGPIPHPLPNTGLGFLFCWFSFIVTVIPKEPELVWLLFAEGLVFGGTARFHVMLVS